MVIKLDNLKITMPKPFYSARIDQDLMDHVQKFMEQTGDSKTDLLIKALSAYIGYQSPENQVNNKIDNNNNQDIEDLKVKVLDLEKALAKQKRLSLDFSERLKKIEFKTKRKLSVIKADNTVDKNNKLNISKLDNFDYNTDNSNIDVDIVNQELSFQTQNNTDEEFVLSQGKMANRIKMSSKELADYRKNNQFKFVVKINNLDYQIEYLGEGKINNKKAQIWKATMITT